MRYLQFPFVAKHNFITSVVILLTDICGI